MVAARVGWLAPVRGPRGDEVAEEVRAEMVGSVLRVEVVEGDVVSAADSLLILESMKMEIPVHPEEGGTVSRIAVAAGDVVQEGDLLVLLS
jgi:acetyl-CoA carboxylase biotin carboxyl carrier protein